MPTAKRKPPTSLPAKKYAPRGGTYSGPATKPRASGPNGPVQPAPPGSGSKGLSAAANRARKKK